jgi:hypothetical protein
MQLGRSALLPLRLTNEDAALVTLEFTRVFQSGLHLSASAVQPHLDRGQRQLQQFGGFFR